MDISDWDLVPKGEEHYVPVLPNTFRGAFAGYEILRSCEEENLIQKQALQSTTVIDSASVVFDSENCKYRYVISFGGDMFVSEQCWKHPNHALENLDDLIRRVMDAQRSE